MSDKLGDGRLLTEMLSQTIRFNDANLPVYIFFDYNQLCLQYIDVSFDFSQLCMRYINSYDHYVDINDMPFIMKMKSSI